MFWLLTRTLAAPTARADRRERARLLAEHKAALKAAAKSGKPATEAAVPTVNDQPVIVQTESARETADGLVFCFILLMLGRAFLLEPFVIPTGSMAPTLYGRHKECACTACGTEFQVGASDEVIGDTSLMKFGTRIEDAICPNCRRPTDIKDALAFTGDHIIVNKWAYELSEPDRWDVFVFKFPENAARNYIKRLVGLPGETVRVRDGDLYLVGDGKQQILRKDAPRKQLAMSQLVYDHDRPAPQLTDAGWPERWRSVAGFEPRGRAFVVAATDAGPAELVYTHYAAGVDDWAIVEQDGQLDPQPSLVLDFCGYNAYSGEGVGYRRPEDITQGIFWVPDLAVEFEVDDLDAASDAASLTVELVEGVYRYRCRFDLAAGTASLIDVNTQQDATEERLRGTIPFALRDNATVRFAQADDQLRVWVNGQLLPFDAPATDLVRGPLSTTDPGEADLSPARIVADGLAVTISHLKLYRDLYYRSDRPSRSADYPIAQTLRERLTLLRKRPDEYAETLAEYRAKFGTITVTADEASYLAFGDNSPRSRDSRLWREDNQSVPRDYLVGKAFWIYWPHGVPFLNGGRGFAVRSHVRPGVNNRPEKVENYPQYEVPFYPQVKRMTRIR